MSRLGTLFGQDESLPGRALYWEFYEQGGKQAIIVDAMKLVCLGALSDVPRYELYDLRSDLGETRNLIDDRPELAEELKKKLAAEHRPNEHWSFVDR